MLTYGAIYCNVAPSGVAFDLISGAYTVKLQIAINSTKYKLQLIVSRFHQIDVVNGAVRKEIKGRTLVVNNTSSLFVFYR